MLIGLAWPGLPYGFESVCIFNIKLFTKTSIEAKYKKKKENISKFILLIQIDRKMWKHHKKR